MPKIGNVRPNLRKEKGILQISTNFSEKLQNSNYETEIKWVLRKNLFLELTVNFKTQPSRRQYHFFITICRIQKIFSISSEIYTNFENFKHHDQKKFSKFAKCSIETPEFIQYLINFRFHLIWYLNLTFFLQFSFSRRQRVI